jgi:hypothetical protein
MKVILLVLCLGALVECGAHDDSDPEYGAMFKQTTHDRIQGTEFWGSTRKKDCVTAGGGSEVCTPAPAD